MNVIRTTTLAIGASLIGSSLFMVLAKPDVLSSIALVMGVVFLLHGTGFLQGYIVRKFLRWYRTKKPVIGIVNDLPWPENGGYGWSWSRMNPEEWHSKVNDIIKKRRINAKAKIIKIAKPWTRWFLDRYLVVINPYGSVYPEIDMENQTIMRLILHYVRCGGMFVNVADIPFSFPYDSKRKIMYGAFTQDVHLYKQLVWQLRQVRYDQDVIETSPPYPYVETPFLRAVKVNIVATEVRKFNSKAKQTEIFPMFASLKLNNSNLILENVAIHRGIVCDSHVKSIVEELEWEREWERMRFTPLCYIHFEKGKFLVSLIFLEHDDNRVVREGITNLLCDLVIKEVKDVLRN
ncbi:MAG: hypothetical protein KAT65_11450 [Methanophagales archaeon]|nr:hypothetical protein [Methanophagales archaeon]